MDIHPDFLPLKLPNVDPETGVADAAVPSQVRPVYTFYDTNTYCVGLQILSKYRRSDMEPQSTPCFGMNSCSLNSGVYRVGDRVRVTRRLKEVEMPITPQKVSS